MGFDRSYIENPGAMVVFATPGMLHAGLSLQIFKKWATCENNMVIMPGYCVQGTVGHKILNGQRRLEMENRTMLEVKMKVEYMSFSAHADAKGIMQLIKQCQPRNVMLVHGEAVKMDFIKDKIKKEFGIECFKPANGETVTIPTEHNLIVETSLSLIKDQARQAALEPPDPKRRRLMHGVLVVKDNSVQLVSPSQALSDLGLEEHHIRFTSTVTVDDPANKTQQDFTQQLQQHFKTKLPEYSVSLSSDGSISVSESVLVKVSCEDDKKSILVSWSFQDEDLGSFLLKELSSGVVT